MKDKTTAKAPKKSRLKKALVSCVAVFIVLVLGLLMAVPVMIMSPVVGVTHMRTTYQPADFGVQADRLTLTTEDGVDLAAWLVSPENPKATVIILSGIENPSVTAFFGYAKMLEKNGYASLLIEMRAHNESGGDSVALGMKEWLDVKAGVEYLDAHAALGALPIVAMGTSMGGATVNVAAGQIDRIDAVISISAYSSWADVFADNMVHMGLPTFFAAAEKPFVNLYSGFVFGFRNLKYTPLNGIENIGDRPILLMHSTEDSQVPYASFERLLARAESVGADVTTFIRKGDHHFICYDEYFENPEGDAEFSGAILTFLDKYFA